MPDNIENKTSNPDYSKYSKGDLEALYKLLLGKMHTSKGIPHELADMFAKFNKLEKELQKRQSK